MSAFQRTGFDFDEAVAEQADYDRQMNDLSELGALAGAELARLNRKYQRRYPFKPVDDNEQFVEDNRGYFEGVARRCREEGQSPGGTPKSPAQPHSRTNRQSLGCRGLRGSTECLPLDHCDG